MAQKGHSQTDHFERRAKITFEASRCSLDDKVCKHAWVYALFDLHRLGLTLHWEVENPQLLLGGDMCARYPNIGCKRMNSKCLGVLVLDDKSKNALT